MELGRFFADVDLNVLNAKGQLVYSKNLKDRRSLTVYIEGSSGIYIIKIKVENQKEETFRVFKN